MCVFFVADKLVVSTSSSLLHTAVDLVNETKLDQEIKSWLAFAAQKILEVNALAKALTGHKDEVYIKPRSQQKLQFKMFFCQFLMLSTLELLQLF